MDLNKPLGMEPKARSRRWTILGAGSAALVLAGLGIALLRADPNGGEPNAIVAITPSPGVAPRQAVVEPPGSNAASPAGPLPAGVQVPPDLSPTGSIAGRQRQKADSNGTVENGVTVYRGTDTASVAPTPATAPQIIDVTRVLDEPTKGTSPFEPKTGTTPARRSARPRVAIFVGGMGLDDAATRTATEIMPAAVSLAFVPYGASLSASVEAAKSKGHEVLLQLPMTSGKGAAPGPHTLTLAESPAALSDDLSWLLGRFQGYGGVTNLLGGAFTADAPKMTAVLKTLGERGLFYVDDGTSHRSLGSSLSASLGVPGGQADVVLDATSDPTIVSANLETLASLARSKGSAIGMASGLPDHLATIARFASELQARGIDLVPLGPLVKDGSPPKAASVVAPSR